MEFDPKLSTQAQPERLVGAATERGPIGPSTPVNTLTRASKDQVAQTPRDISKLDDDRPVPKVDIFGAISSIAGSAGQLAGAFQGRPQSQSDIDNEVLKPYARELQKLNRAKGKGAKGINSRLTLTASEFIVNNPRLEREALSLLENLTGVKGLVKEETSIEDINAANQQDYLTNTTEGRLVADRASKMDPSQQATFIQQNYSRFAAQNATISNAKVRLDSAKTNQELLELENEKLSKDIATDQSRRIQELLNNEIIPETISETEPFDAFEDMASLRELRELRAAEFRAEYQGFDPEVVNARLKEVLEPMDRIINMLEEGGEDINKLAKIQGNKAVLELTSLLQDEGFGPVFQTPDGIKAITSALIYQDMLSVPKVAEVYRNKYNLNEGGKISEPPVSDEGDTSSTLIETAKKFFFDNPDERRDAVRVSSDIMTGPELDTPENIQTAFDAGIELIGLISAGDDVLDDNAFGEFVNKNLFRFSQLATLPGEQGEQFTRALNGMLVKQMAINTWDAKQLNKNMPAGFFIDYDSNFKLQFNMKAFENAEDSLTENIRVALKENGLPVTEENILAVLENPTEFTAKNSPIGGRTSSVQNQALILGNSSYRSLMSKVERLNNIDATAKNVPTIKGWEAETNAAITRSDKEFKTSVLTETAIIKEEDMKRVKEKREIYPKYNSETLVEEELAKGVLKYGDIINLNGDIYVVEE